MSDDYLALPEGLSAERFTAALARFAAIVGPAQVLSGADALAAYAKIMIPDDDARHAPAAALLPASVEEIQRIVAVCNEFRVPIWPIATGKNLGYGSAAPATRGQVVLDLGRMNRILEIDAELCTALVEPGVTYQQLHDYIRTHSLPLWPSCPVVFWGHPRIRLRPRISRFQLTNRC